MRKFDGKIYEIPDGGPSDEFLHLYKAKNASIPDLPSERTKLAYMVATQSGLEQEFGRASLQEVLIDYTFWLIWAESRYESSKGSFSRFAKALLLKAIEKHKKKLGYNKIRRELDDQKFRDAAEKKDEALVAYLQLWVKRVQSFQKVRPSRWNVRGFDKEDLISELKVYLIQSIRDGSIVDYERPGEEATFLFLRNKIDFLTRTPTASPHYSHFTPLPEISNLPAVVECL